MDHIKLPRDRDPFEFTVPLFATDAHKYDRQGFEGFPVRKGFDPISIARFETPSEALSFVQAWLYFGVLAEIFGNSFRQNDFLRSDHSSVGLRIYTGLLPVYIASRSSSTYSRDKDVLKAAHNACNSLDRDSINEGKEWPTLLLSIRVLLESLVAHLQINLDINIHSGQPSIGPVREHLATRPGWCPHRLHLIENCNSYLTALYLANLRRHIEPWIRHEDCSTQDHCMAYDIDERTFQSRHVLENCTCKFTGPPKEDMLRILKDGGIPIVRCTFGHDGMAELSYARASPGAQYAAISHLWADGLANQIDNTLPHCQVQRLAHIVADASRLHTTWSNLLPCFRVTSVYFWLDTFCVPIVRQDELSNTVPAFSLEEISNLKQMALQRMFATYSWAQYVIVIDSELACLNASADETEMWARINLCGWNTRCWYVSLP
jgi:hypothetical protein